MNVWRCAAVAVWACLACAAQGPPVIPWPQQIELSAATIPVAGFRVVAEDNDRARIAAAEINDRIASLGGVPLPVVPLAGGVPDSDVIIVGTCTAPALIEAARELGVTVETPGPQGYVIEPRQADGRRRLYLIGSDDLGALYAAVTLRQFMTRHGGQVVLREGRVRDWPHVRLRLNGTPFAEPLRGDWYAMKAAEHEGDAARARELADRWVEEQTQYVDWMLRAKINGAWNRVNVRPGDAPENTTVIRDALRRVHDYARVRGIRSFAADTTAIGTYPADKDNPDFRDVAYHRSHKRYFCWSRLHNHEVRAKRAARWLRDAGFSGYYLHATDGGGWQNPELWQDRCPQCRERYGDDRALADATVFGIYEREVRRLIPDITFAAVIYPYTGRYLDPDFIYTQAAATMGEGQPARNLARQTVDELRSFIRRLDNLLPRDMYVCIRESDRHYLDLAREAWGQRRFFTYYEYAYWKGWRPYFVTTPLWTQGLYYPGYEDILYGNASGQGWREMTQLLGAECAWNTSRPGSGPFSTTTWREIGTRLEPPPERAAFALRGAAFMFGEQAAPHVAPVYAENISWLFIVDPDEVLRHTDIDDPVATMAAQAEAAARAAEALERMRTSGVMETLPERQRGYLGNLYVITHGARILAQHRHLMMAAHEAVRSGDRTRVEALLDKAAASLSTARAGWALVQQHCPPDQRLAPYLRPAAATGFLSSLDLDALQSEVTDLRARAETMIAAYTIPRWFEQKCREREISAVPADEPVTVDGRLDEDVWRGAPLIEHFLNHSVLRLASLETVARLAWDAQAVYVAFECFDPEPGNIAEFLAGADQHRLADTVEVFLAPHARPEAYAQWIVDANGTVFDARQTPMPDAMPAYSSDWDGTATVAATRGKDRWTVEMRIPAEDAGVRTHADGQARILLCRNIVHTLPREEAESNAIVFLDGSGFRTPAKFAALRFLPGSPEPDTVQLGLTLRPIEFRHVTTGEGAGTEVGGELAIETNRNLHDVVVRVRLSDGAEPLGEYLLGKADLVRLVWRPRKRFLVLVPQEVPGVVCEFTLSCREGEWSFVRRLGSPRPPAETPTLYCPGRSQQAVCYPVWISAAPLNQDFDWHEGTLEFWVQPRWDTTVRPTEPRGALEHVFLNFGPIRPDYPYLSNRDSVTLAHTNWGALLATISNSDYASRQVSAMIRSWTAGEWHHVAFQWRLDDDGRTAMSIFLDGRLAADDCRGGTRHPNTAPLPFRALPLPIQVGAMNTGFRPADAAIDDLRISRVRRYSEAFDPPVLHDADETTVCLFRFDASLEADIPSGLVAIPGPAQQRQPDR